MGRPPDYKPEYCEQLIKHMQDGFSYESFAASIGTHRSTLYNWEKQYPEFLDTKKIAMEMCQFWWEKAGKDGLYSVFGEDEKGRRAEIEKCISPSLWIFNMKARFRWKDSDPTPDELPPGTQPTLTIEDKKKMLIQGEQELKKLREELEKVNG